MSVSDSVWKFSNAIVRRPAPSVTGGLRADDQGDPDFVALQTEHDEYIHALRNAGVAVTILPPLEEFPDSIFVEDPALVFTNGAILLRPGAETRRGEVEGIEPELRRTFSTVLEISTHGCVEGGDVLVTRDKVHAFTVTESESGASAPTPTLEITLSSEQGIEVEGATSPGRHTVAVHFSDQVAHENFVGHDVHLVQLEADTDMEALKAWMDWTQPTGLQTPAPVVFVGGTNEMPAGETAYFTVELEPGRYAWIAEVPNSIEKGMVKTFTVSPEPGSDR